MNIETIYQDASTIVKKVYYMGKFSYTRTYKFNEEGLCAKQVTVFANGTIDIQEF